MIGQTNRQTNRDYNFIYIEIYNLVGRGQSSRSKDMTAGPSGSETGIT